MDKFVTYTFYEILSHTLINTCICFITVCPWNTFAEEKGWPIRTFKQ